MANVIIFTFNFTSCHSHAAQFIFHFCVSPSFSRACPVLKKAFADYQDSSLANTGDREAFAQGDSAYFCVCVCARENVCVCELQDNKKSLTSTVRSVETSRSHI